MNLPTTITFARILLIPLFAMLYLHPHPATYLASASTFAVAAATDWLDGYLARSRGQTTPFGAFLDPVADKLIVATALVLLVAHHGNFWVTLPALVIISRELVVSALREWMAGMRESVRVAVSALGKVKTAFQMVAITLLLALSPSGESNGIIVGCVLLSAAAALALWSMIEYLKAAWPTLKAGLAVKGDTEEGETS